MKIVLHNKERIHIKARDWLLLIGMTLAPMTSLRIWKVGPAEVICLIWGLRFMNGRNKDSMLFRFFTGFLAAMLVGTFIGIIMTPSETEVAGLLTWLYFAIVAINLFVGLSRNTLKYNEKLLITFVRMASFVYIFLCVYGVYIAKTFFGLQLFYGNVRYSGGATNPHQVALLLSVLITLSLRDVVRRGNIPVDVLCIAGCIFALSKTTSSTAIMATTLGALIWINSIILKKEEHQTVFYIVEVIVIGVIFALFYEKIFQLIYDWIASDSNGLGRLEIFKSYSITFGKSPIFGLGPGNHARNGVMEYHNTYLEILAATGIIGMIVFIVFTVRLVAKIMKGDIYLLPSIVACYVFGLAGFGMRRLPYWITMVFAIVIAEQMQRAKSDNEGYSLNIATEQERNYLYAGESNQV